MTDGEKLEAIRRILDQTDSPFGDLAQRQREQDDDIRRARESQPPEFASARAMAKPLPHECTLPGPPAGDEKDSEHPTDYGGFR
jgi:hypothetical protein